MKHLLILACLNFAYLSTPTFAKEVSETSFEASSIPETNMASLQVIFEQGLVAKASNDLSIAIKLFRLVLVVNPNYFPARRALVDSLLSLGEYEAAEFHLRTLIETDPNPEVADIYFAILDQTIKNRPLQLNASFSIFPSTNINNGTKNIYFDSQLGRYTISESGRETSGTGVYLGTSGTYRRSLGNGNSLNLNGSLAGAWYQDETLRHLDGKFSVSFESIEAKTNWSLEAYTRRNWYIHIPESASSDVEAYGVSVDYEYDLSEVNSVGVSAFSEYQSYIEKTYQSGPMHSATFKLEHRASADTLYSLNFGVQEHQPEAEHLAYQGLSLSAGVTKSWGNSFTTGITVGVGKRDYIENYTALTFPRMDQFYSIGMSVQNSKLKLFDTIPRINCTYKRNHSNVAFYDYQTTNCQISLTRNF